MNDPTRPPSLPLALQPQPAPSKPRFVRVRGWLRSRTGRIVVPIVALYIGVILGIAVIFLYGLSGEGQVIVEPGSGRGSIIVEADKTFLTQLVKKNLHDSGMPGTIENVELDLVQGDQITINGDDGFSVLGVRVTKHFKLMVQPYVRSCVLQINVVHADLSSIPVTGFAQTFASHINQQLRNKTTGLPSGFQYCTTGVRTEPEGMFVTYVATPV